MFSRSPRYFLLASAALLVIVVYTTYYLYDDIPIYRHPSPSPKPASAAPVAEQAVVPEANGFAGAVEFADDNAAPAPVVEAPGPGLMQDGQPQDPALLVLPTPPPVSATALVLDNANAAGSTAVTDTNNAWATDDGTPQPTDGYQQMAQDEPYAPQYTTEDTTAEGATEGATEGSTEDATDATGEDTTDTKPKKARPTVTGGLRPVPSPKDCPKDMDLLVGAANNLGLTKRVRYTRRCIEPVFSSKIDRNKVVNVSEPLLKGETEFDLWDCMETQLPECTPLQLSVPPPYPHKKYDHLIFGISTDYARLGDSILTFAHWLAGTGAKLVCCVTDMQQRSPRELEYLEWEFRAAGIDAILTKPLDPNFDTSQNHFAVLRDMALNRGPNTQWYGLLDDDTFFPNLAPLSDALGALDHTQDAYVGALSEDFNAVRTFGFMAFGGAGAYVSAPLAIKMANKVYRCLYEATSSQGDIIIRDCVYSQSKAKLTILSGLHQQDLRGDVSGFFESGLQMLNLHHWKSWYDEPVVQMATTANFCGDCFLQRWRFSNDTVFTNGFSIATYRDGLHTVDLDSIEGTWDMFDRRDYDFSIGPVREAYPPEQKKSYKLWDVDLSDDGVLRQLYIWPGNITAGEIDEVVELVWRR